MLFLEAISSVALNDSSGELVVGYANGSLFIGSISDKMWSQVIKNPLNVTNYSFLNFACLFFSFFFLCGSNFFF